MQLTTKSAVCFCWSVGRWFGFVSMCCLRCGDLPAILPSRRMCAFVFTTMPPYLIPLTCQCDSCLVSQVWQLMAGWLGFSSHGGGGEAGERAQFQGLTAKSNAGVNWVFSATVPHIPKDFLDVNPPSDELFMIVHKKILHNARNGYIHNYIKLPCILSCFILLGQALAFSSTIVNCSVTLATLSQWEVCSVAFHSFPVANNNCILYLFNSLLFCTWK